MRGHRDVLSSAYARGDRFFERPDRAHKRLGSIVSEGRQFWKFTSGRAIGFHALMLGKMYRDGIVLPRNDVAAHKWLDISERWTPNASGWSIETPDGPVPLADEIRTRRGTTSVTGNR